MRYFLILILIFPPPSFGQQANKLTLELSTGDCRTNESVRIGFQDTIRFYQNGKLYKQIIPMNYSQWPIEIEDFESGIYTITYKNIYDQKITKSVKIPDTKEYELELCPDLLEIYPKNTLATLQNGESIKINFYSSGCFHNEKQILTISKSKDLLFAQLQHNGETKHVSLKITQFDAFKRFENELRVLKDSYGCTTVDIYTLISKSGTVKRTDGGCEWNGFDFLIESFFGKN